MNWIKLFENDNFIIDYNFDNNTMRVSYFENNHFIEDCVFKFPVRCYGCKYFKKGNCIHPDASYCVNGELWWPVKGE